MYMKYEDVKGCDYCFGQTIIDKFLLKDDDILYKKSEDTAPHIDTRLVYYFKEATLAEIMGVKFLMVDFGGEKENNRTLIPMTEVKRISISLI